MFLLEHDRLVENGYKIENAKITNVSLNMKNHGCLTLDLTLEGYGWGCVYGGYCLGNGYLGADEFVGSARGEQAIMEIMNTIGVEDLNECKGKYVRVATKGWGSSIKIIGNIIKDKWFDYETFFADAAQDE